jgi:hypothetical protein
MSTQERLEAAQFPRVAEDVAGFDLHHETVREPPDLLADVRVAFREIRTREGEGVRRLGATQGMMAEPEVITACRKSKPSLSRI